MPSLFVPCGTRTSNVAGVANGPTVVLAHIDPLCGLGREFTPAVGKLAPALRAFCKYGSCGGIRRRFCAVCAERLIVEAFLDLPGGFHSSITLPAEEGAAQLGSCEPLLRLRADELQISRESIDTISGMQDGFVGKVLAPVPIKRLGWNTLQIDPRNNNQVRMFAVHACGGKVLLSQRFMRFIASKNGRARAAKTNPKRRQQIARNAALIRWKAVKAAAVEPAEQDA